MAVDASGDALAGGEIMAVIQFRTGLRWTLVVVLLAAVGVLSVHMPRPDLPADTGDPVEERFHQQVRTIGDAMADAYKRGDQETGNRLLEQFHQVVADYKRYFRERHPLTEAPPQQQP
jgi:hypothetical protein